MIKLALSLTMVGMVGVANALTLNLVPNGDFEAADDSLTWVGANGGSATVFTYPSTGGNGGGYGSIAEPGGGWAVLVNPIAAGVVGGGIPVASLGVIPGVAYDFQQDMKNFSGTGTGGLKIEAWAGNALIGNSGDMIASGNSTQWATYQFNWLVPAATQKLIFVPIWGPGSTVGYDNVGVIANVVPEPTTFALAGLGAAALLIFRRRS